MDPARLERVVDFARQAPDSYLFYGYRDSALPQQVGAGVTGFNGGGFDLSRWDPPPGLEMLVFLPSGALITNGVVVDGARHVVCCDGAAWAGGSVDGVTLPRLTQVANPYTVRVSISGQVDLVSGVPKSAGVVPDRPSRPLLPPPPRWPGRRRATRIRRRAPTSSPSPWPALYRPGPRARSN